MICTDPNLYELLGSVEEREEWMMDDMDFSILKDNETEIDYEDY